MATVTYESFLPEVMLSADQVPQMIALNAIRNTCIDFCIDSSFWQATQTAVLLSSSDFPYTHVPPAGANVSRVLSVVVEGSPFPIPPTNIDELDAKVPEWRTKTGTPVAYFQTGANDIVLFPLPNKPMNVTFRVAYAPTRTSTAVVDTVYEYFQEDIVAGALSRLFAIPNKPWTNPNLVGINADRFAQAKRQAAIDASRSFNRGPLSVRMR